MHPRAARGHTWLALPHPRPARPPFALFAQLQHMRWAQPQGPGPVPPLAAILRETVTAVEALAYSPLGQLSLVMLHCVYTPAAAAAAAAGAGRC